MGWHDCYIAVHVPQDGVWIRGLFLEGAGWEKKSSSLVEANPMQLVCPMPTIHFKPVEGKRRSTKGRWLITLQSGDVPYDNHKICTGITLTASSKGSPAYPISVAMLSS